VWWQSLGCTKRLCGALRREDHAAGRIEGLEIHLGCLERSGGPTTFSALDTVLAMMVLANGTELLSKLALVHRSQCPPGIPSSLEPFTGFHLHVRRIVHASTEEQMREYLASVARGPEDTSFSLSWGVPLKHVAVLRNGACGSGLIAIPTSGSEALAAARVGGTETLGESCSSAHTDADSERTDVLHACKKRKITTAQNGCS
jgi:hypothetical protein